MTCDRCGHDVQVGEWPFCPHGFGTSRVNGDACDLVQENGFHHPRRFTSKSELRRALAERGLEERVRHVSIPGTDKSPYTTDWSKGSIDPYTLAAGAELVKRNGTGHAKDDPDPTGGLRVQWSVRTIE